jgi:hypothetical protein
MKRRFAFLLAAAFMAACDSTEPPRGGVYRAVLQSPSGAEGAALVSLSGGGIEKITSPTGQVFSQVSPNGASVAIFREPAGTLEFDVQVATGHEAPSAQVVEVVDGADRMRGFAGYHVTFSRMEVAQ